MRTEQLVDGAGMAGEIDEEGPEQILVDALIFQQMMDVEKVTWMLAVKRGRHLARIEVGQGDDLHFGETEAVLDGSAHGPDLGREDRAAQDRGNLDLDGGSLDVDDQPLTVAQEVAIDPETETGFKALGDAFEAIASRGE